MAVLDQNGVPILALSEDTKKQVADSDGLLTGEVVALHNELPIHPVPGASQDVTVFHIGAETLDEAAKSVVGAFDGVFGHRPPAELGSTHKALGEVLAEHYQANLVPIDKVIA